MGGPLTRKSPITRALLGGLLGLAVLAARSVAQGGTSVHVCVGVDRVLRLSPGTSCPAGQASYNLALDGTQPQPPDEDKTAAKEIGELKKSLDFLRDRVSNLEKEAAKHENNETGDEHIVHAPFHVVDKAGNPLFTVIDGDVRQGLGRVRVAHGPTGNFGVWIANASGTLLAALAATKDGDGSVTAYDRNGNRRFQTNGGGAFTLFSPSGKDVASIGLNDAKPDRGVLQLSGLFQVFDEAGQTIVEAGTSSKTGVGVVRVGPGATCVPQGPLRVPDCIMGRHSP